MSDLGYNPTTGHLVYTPGSGVAPLHLATGCLVLDCQAICGIACPAGKTLCVTSIDVTFSGVTYPTPASPADCGAPLTAKLNFALNGLTVRLLYGAGQWSYEDVGQTYEVDGGGGGPSVWTGFFVRLVGQSPPGSSCDVLVEAMIGSRSGSPGADIANLGRWEAGASTPADLSASITIDNGPCASPSGCAPQITEGVGCGGAVTVKVNYVCL